MAWALDLARLRQAAPDSPPLFGVVLYTDAHANIKKVLRDQDYWEALNEMSGQQWAVFAVRAHPGRWDLPKVPPGSFGLFHPVWKEPAANHELLAAFEIDDTSILPTLVVFALENAESLRRIVIKLDDSTPEAAFESLRKSVQTVAAALQAVAPQGRTAPGLLLAAVENAVQRYRNKERLKSAYAVLKELRDWLPF